MKQRIKLPKTLALLFLSAFGAAAVVSATGTAHAGWWRLAGITCAKKNDGTWRCPVADSSAMQPNRELLNANIEVYDRLNYDEVWAAHCLRWAFGPSFICGPAQGSGVQFTGAKTLTPDRRWSYREVLHGWTAADSQHFAYVVIYDQSSGPAESVQFKGIFYYW